MNNDVYWLFIICIVIALFGGAMGAHHGAINKIRKEACDAGVGEYYISTNNYSREFRWKAAK